MRIYTAVDIPFLESTTICLESFSSEQLFNNIEIFGKINTREREGGNRSRSKKEKGEGEGGREKREGEGDFGTKVIKTEH